MPDKNLMELKQAWLASRNVGDRIKYLAASVRYYGPKEELVSTIESLYKGGEKENNQEILTNNTLVELMKTYWQEGKTSKLTNNQFGPAYSLMRKLKGANPQIVDDKKFNTGEEDLVLHLVGGPQDLSVFPATKSQPKLLGNYEVRKLHDKGFILSLVKEDSFAASFFDSYHRYQVGDVVVGVFYRNFLAHNQYADISEDQDEELTFADHSNPQDDGRFDLSELLGPDQDGDIDIDDGFVF